MITKIIIDFRHEVECYACEDLGIVSEQKTIYLDNKNEKGKTVGGFFCKKCFDKIIKNYLESEAKK